MGIDMGEVENEKIRDTKLILSEIDELYKKQSILDKTIKGLLKELEKQIKVDLKEASRKKKTIASSEKREPSGFNAKQLVPPEFNEEPWNIPPDQKLARTKLTKTVYDYIRNEKLQNPDDKRMIYPDKALKKLFHLTDNDELHFNNFQTYMKRLYKRNFDDALTTESSQEESALEEIVEKKVVSKKEKEKEKEKKKIK